MRLLVLSFNWMSDESFGMSDCYKAYVYTPELLNSYKTPRQLKFKLCG